MPGAHHAVSQFTIRNDFPQVRLRFGSASVTLRIRRGPRRHSIMFSGIRRGITIEFRQVFSDHDIRQAVFILIFAIVLLVVFAFSAFFSWKELEYLCWGQTTTAELTEVRHRRYGRGGDSMPGSGDYIVSYNSRIVRGRNAETALLLRNGRGRSPSPSSTRVEALGSKDNTTRHGSPFLEQPAAPSLAIL